MARVVPSVMARFILFDREDDGNNEHLVRAACLTRNYQVYKNYTIDEQQRMVLGPETSVDGTAVGGSRSCHEQKKPAKGKNIVRDSERLYGLLFTKAVCDFYLKKIGDVSVFFLFFSL